MKAVLHRTYGSPESLSLEEVEEPTPRDGEVLIRIRAASVNPFDWHLMRGAPYLFRVMTGLFKPRDARLGVDVAGQVEAVGGSVTQLKPGDSVVGVCRGAFAEYACAPESSLVTKPDNVTFEEAAAMPIAGLTALQALRDKGHVQPGQKVLINGAAGGVGTFAVQIAKAFGADVAGVCSTRNVEMVRSLGAERAIDYTQEDFAKGESRYDLIVDCIGNHSLSSYRRVLTPEGTCVLLGGSGGAWKILTTVLHALVLSRFGSQRFLLLAAKTRREDLTVLRDLLQTGKVAPVIDRLYPLSEVPDAIRYLAEGHARGKVVITVGRP